MLAAFTEQCRQLAAQHAAGTIDWFDAVDSLVVRAELAGIAAEVAAPIIHQAMNTARAPAKDPASRTPQSTIDALAYALRRGLAALNDPHTDNLRRLGDCDARAFARLVGDLKTWPAEELESLCQLWRAVRSRRRHEAS